MKQATLLLILLLAAGALLAEGLVLRESPELYNIFLASYVDPMDPMSQPIIFHADITGTNPSTDYQMVIYMEWNGNVLLDGGTVDAITPFASMTYTSRDIIAEENQYFKNGSFGMDDVLDNNPDFEDAVKNTGRFPDGRYMVHIDMMNMMTDSIVASDDLVFNIVSPISIQPLYPGSAIGGPVQPYIETFPNFIWASNLQNYGFYLWELEPGMNVSAEDVENMQPDYACASSMSSLSYPADAPALQVGGVYAWQVRGGLVSPADRSGSDNAIKSSVFVFRVANPEDNTVYNQILANFLNNIDGDTYSEVFDLLSQGFAPTGNIVFNGQEMSFEELNALLIQILNGEIEVKGLIIE